MKERENEFATIYTVPKITFTTKTETALILPLTLLLACETRVKERIVSLHSAAIRFSQVIQAIIHTHRLI